jgi:predicted RecB family nuclease
MKCWLRAKQTCEAATENAYSQWVERQLAAHRSKGIESLFAAISETECAISVQKAALKTAKWCLAANVFVNAGKAESCLHALERIPPEGRGKSVQFVPIRFIPTEKVTPDDKLTLGFDALVLSDSLGRKIISGKLIHGNGFAVSHVKTPALFSFVRRKMQTIAELLASEAPPDLALNRHCPECQFRNHCRGKAIEKDDLSLLGGLSVKEREKLRNKGIFLCEPAFLHVSTPSPAEAAATQGREIPSLPEGAGNPGEENPPRRHSRTENRKRHPRIS